MTPRPSPRFWMRGWTHVLLIKILNKFRYHVFPIKIPLGEALVTPMCVKNKIGGRAAFGREGEGERSVCLALLQEFLLEPLARFVSFPGPPCPFLSPVGDELSAVISAAQSGPAVQLTLE